MCVNLHSDSYIDRSTASQPRFDVDIVKTQNVSITRRIPHIIFL